MNRLISAGGLTVAALLVLTACNGSEEAEPEPTPTMPSPTSAPPDSTDVNACTVLPEDEISPLNPRDRELVNTLLIGDLTFDGYTGDRLRCTYLGEDLATVQLSRAPASNAEDFLDVDPSYEDELELPGTVAAKINVSERSVAVTIQPTAEEVSFVTVRGEGDESVDPDAVIVLVEDFLEGSG